MSSSDEESSSSSSRSVSPSLALSPSLSADDLTPPTLERLVLHFVSAKRSLASATQIYRANELVTHSRLLIEEVAHLNAKNTFARRALVEQVDTLTAVRDTLIDDGDQVALQFDGNVRELDAVHENLGNILDGLKGTVVAGSEEVEEDEESKTLFDFIDEATHENLLDGIRASIDSYHASRGRDLEQPLEDFNTRLKNLNATLSSSASELGSSSEEAEHAAQDASLRLKPTTIYSRKEHTESQPASIATLFQTLTAHAQNLASLLGNLVKHYDLCVSALKHTEGGGEAAKRALDAQEQPVATDDSLYGARYEPMEQGEREEMLKVLVGDAGEVEDVMSEMTELAHEMEVAYNDLLRRVETSRKGHKSLQSVLQKIRVLRTTVLPGVLQTSAHFTGEFFPSLSEELQGKTRELVELVQFYEQFQRGYGALLKEVKRRQGVAERAKSVAIKAQRELDRIFDADREAREDFVEDVGGFLPRELGVRFGLEERGIRWVVGEEGEESPEEGRNVLNDG